MSCGTRLFVGNLPENTNENELRGAFSSYGEITSVDLKTKSGSTDEQKKFAFVTISSSNNNIESCIKHFTNEEFNGVRLYVTRARESFLERLQRERQETQKKLEDKEKHEDLPKHNPIVKISEKLNPRKRKSDVSQCETNFASKFNKTLDQPKYIKSDFNNEIGYPKLLPKVDKKKQDSEKKRLESMKKKRQEFKEKQIIIKTGLTSVDKAPNKKVIFSDNENYIELGENGHIEKPQKQDIKNTLFDDNDDSEDEVNFKIKEQFEGKKGQKILDLQSRYKSDKRFVLDERFIDGDQSETEEQKEEAKYEEIELEQTGEKTKQLSILQDVLGVAIKTRTSYQDNKKLKTKPGMLRFDPLQPDHARFLMPVEEKKQDSKKKNKDKKEEFKEQVQGVIQEKVEVSKDQFYKVSETLKEAIAQPTSFSLRSLFAKNEDVDTDPQEQEIDYIPLEKPSKPKVKNPLDPGEKNPFVYDSSDSEAEEDKEEKTKTQPLQAEPKAIWKENLFFSNDDTRLKEALLFFNKPNETEVMKERRELKLLMKKRIYNKERKNQMFQKKIGGRKKTMKKSYNKMKSKHS